MNGYALIFQADDHIKNEKIYSFAIYYYEKKALHSILKIMIRLINFFAPIPVKGLLLLHPPPPPRIVDDAWVIINNELYISIYAS